MSVMRQRHQGGTRFVQGTMPAESQRTEPSHCSQFWPAEPWDWSQSQFWPADSATDTGSEALMREVLTGFEREGSVRDRLAGYRSESQGE